MAAAGVAVEGVDTDSQQQGVEEQQGPPPIIAEEQQEEAEQTAVMYVADFFPEVSDDMTKVVWAHRVNSLATLQAALEDDKIMMLEADVLPGNTVQAEEEEEEEGEGGMDRPTPPPLPIMAHPPNKTSDISLAKWLDLVILANKAGKKKGIKLDFKDISVVKDSLKILSGNKSEISFPVWLNADVLHGPVSSVHHSTPTTTPTPTTTTTTPTTTTTATTTTPTLPLEEFVSACTHMYPQATLSLGWSTSLPVSTTGEVGRGYSLGEVEAMIEGLRQANVTQPVTFPIRAAFLPTSLDLIEHLLDSVLDSSVTIWSAADDPFDPEALATLVDLVGCESVYLDLPGPLLSLYQQRTATDSVAKFSFLPNSVSTIATVGVALASALAALYLYE